MHGQDLIPASQTHLQVRARVPHGLLVMNRRHREAKPLVGCHPAGFELASELCGRQGPAGVSDCGCVQDGSEDLHLFSSSCPRVYTWVGVEFSPYLPSYLVIRVFSPLVSMHSFANWVYERPMVKLPTAPNSCPAPYFFHCFSLCVLMMLNAGTSLTWKEILVYPSQTSCLVLVNVCGLHFYLQPAIIAFS